MRTYPPVEERVWAVLAHLSAIAMGMGILIPIVAWSDSRRKSNFTSFQCLQALGYQSLGYTLWILATLVVLIITGLDAMGSLSALDFVEEELTSIVFSHTALMFGLMGIYLILPVWGAVACALGKDFRYPIMGKRLADYLGFNPFTTISDKPVWLNEEHEDRWVASMGHFAVIILLWGMLAPATAWLTHGKRSDFLKFQSIQALTFQFGTLILYFISGAFVLGGTVFFLISVGGMEAANLDSTVGWVGLIVFLGSMLCTFVIVLMVPLLHLLGQWAGYRILKGDDYRYPIVGKWVEIRMRKSTSTRSAY